MREIRMKEDAYTEFKSSFTDAVIESLGDPSRLRQKKYIQNHWSLYPGTILSHRISFRVPPNIIWGSVPNGKL